MKFKTITMQSLETGQTYYYKGKKYVNDAYGNMQFEYDNHDEIVKKKGYCMSFPGNQYVLCIGNWKVQVEE